MEFQKFDKIARLSRDIVITEKIDGTNAQIYICTLTDINNSFAGDYQYQNLYCNEFIERYCLYNKNGFYIFAGSRRKWLDITSKGDNFGFAKWVKANAEELLKLGEGRHYGEWYGKGIQRGYGLDEKRFALFNTGRWVKKQILTQLQLDILDQRPEWEQNLEPHQNECPKCCEVVPVLYKGMFNTQDIEKILQGLKEIGSAVVHKFMNPEGIVIYHTASAKLFKKTILNDEKPKGE